MKWRIKTLFIKCMEIGFPKKLPKNLMHFYEVVDDEHVNDMHIQCIVNDVPILLKFEVLTFG